MKKLSIILFLCVNICCQVFAETIDLDSIAKRFAGTGITSEVLEVVDTLTDEILDILFTEECKMVYEGKECVFYLNRWGFYLKRQDENGNWEYWYCNNSTLVTLIKDLVKKCFGFIRMYAGEIVAIKARV